MKLLVRKRKNPLNENQNDEEKYPKLNFAQGGEFAETLIFKGVNLSLE